MTEQHIMSSNTNSNFPVSEVYWSLVDKADKKFSKIRDLPYYERNRYDTYFYKVFKVYTQLWKFQQENRQKLVEAGLKRWEIGEIASRIAQLYYGQYMRTSDSSYLSESYVFYEAILSREYFKDGLFQDLNLANKQLRFFARFLMVSLVWNRREMVHQLVNQLKILVDECRRAFQMSGYLSFEISCLDLDVYEFVMEMKTINQHETDFKEWKLVVQEISRFLKADTTFMNIRPLRYSLVLDLHPDSLPRVATRRSLKLRDAILSSYHHNEVKFSELTVDTFRMLQCLEWEPSGSFYQSSSTKNGQNGGSGSSRINYAQDIADPTLPLNSRKAVLYRPSVTHFLAVLGTICEELAPDGVILIYLSASGRVGHPISPPSGGGTSINTTENTVRNFQSHAMYLDAVSTSPFSSSSNSPNPSSRQSKLDCLHFGTRGNGGLNNIYPTDLIPFTRRPLLIVIDSDSSEAFKAMGLKKWQLSSAFVAISGAEKGEPAAIILSPSCSIPLTTADSSRHHSGSLLTMFLTAPLQTFCLLIGLSGPDVEMDTYNKAEKLLSSSLNEWGLTLATSDILDPVWAQILGDPFLRRLLLRFLFCRAVLTLFAPSFGKKEFHPECMPSLLTSLQPNSSACQTVVLQIASIFGAAKKFIISEGIVLPEHCDVEMASSS
ncbi:hypothetical protein SADUNF_Sadunf13G0059700 [Salix dunnii]|uniref:Protein SCAI n=1 Tax=Salix dunnii TaxID=1413687 RepID=A0A835MLS8_9ROSI|nr:hypothetical protein SADUNF_Sadunf13G0059700 [Salix dunnii]